jgi:DNA recombination protein RmuC
MNMPIEPARLMAIHEHEGLWRYGSEGEVLLAEPTTLLFVISIDDNLWKQRTQPTGCSSICLSICST